MNKAEAVAQFHELAGQPVQTELTLPDIKAIRFRQHFLLEEVIEGFEALCDPKRPTTGLILQALRNAQIRTNELTEQDIALDAEAFFDSLLDIEYVIQGTGHYYGLPMEKGFEEVHEKNLTRFPANDADLTDTLNKAKQEGVEVTYHLNKRHNRWAVVRADNGKLYKNANHVKPDLLSLIS